MGNLYLSGLIAIIREVKYEDFNIIQWIIWFYTTLNMMPRNALQNLCNNSRLMSGLLVGPKFPMAQNSKYC